MFVAVEEAGMGFAWSRKNAPVPTPIMATAALVAMRPFALTAKTAALAAVAVAVSMALGFVGKVAESDRGKLCPLPGNPALNIPGTSSRDSSTGFDRPAIPQ